MQQARCSAEVVLGLPPIDQSEKLKLKITVRGNCGMHQSFEEWQNCSACERIMRNMRRKRD